jgi:mono/diheme cytochrome c family protein/plastocyanin
MTDQPQDPGTEPEAAPGPDAEQRLPVPREEPVQTVSRADRFTSAPPIRRFELTPERAAQVVRQSANARWVGFLAVIVVILFVSIYWFYELGLPGDLSEPRLESEVAAQQVTAVERGYNVYEANCARCHGEEGEGGIGPVLNRQDKLFQHLNEDYLLNILTVGGRLACGDPNSIMPIWADSGHPPGPLNYRQIQELIAFLRAPSDQTFIKRDHELLDPLIDPVTGEVETFHGWVDPTYQPAPGATPYPACWKDEFATAPSAAPSGDASAAPSGEPSGEPTGEAVTVTASGIAFTTPSVTAPADTEFTLRFDNQDAGIPHDVDIRDAAGATVFKTDIFPGVEARDYSVPALAAGEYSFVCTVHPNMTGTLSAS